MVRLKDGIVSIVVDGECVVVDTDTGRYLVSNEVANVMMATLYKELPEEQTITELLDTLDVEPGKLRDDLRQFQETLVQLNLACRV
jgi:hypothetical protein